MVNSYLDIPSLDTMLPDHRNHVCLAQGLSPIASPASSCHLVFNKCVQLNHWVDLGHMQRGGQTSGTEIFLVLFIVSLLLKQKFAYQKTWLLTLAPSSSLLFSLHLDVIICPWKQRTICPLSLRALLQLGG